MTTVASPTTGTATERSLGYRTFQVGRFTFSRDEYFVHVIYPGGRHVMPVDEFLRALMRDIAWGFFYGTVNFDHVLGTVNHYGTVELFVGLFNDAYRHANRHYVETHDSKVLKVHFEEILADWTNEGFDPFAAPDETGSAYGVKRGQNLRAIKRQRVVAQRMVGLGDDTPLRSDASGFKVNRQFVDVPQDEPEVHAESGCAGQVHAFNLFSYLSRSDVTWNPSVCSVVKDSLLCPTTEEHVLPITHGNDRVEWFVQVTDEIFWDIEDKATGKPLAKVTMKAGDVAAMPADIRHRGYSPKRSMLIVWENNDNQVAKLHQSGKIPPYPVEF
ncbi:MAG: hydroxyquinol 1,2-dioxygenase [Vicinamibacterales bacterium]